MLLIEQKFKYYITLKIQCLFFHVSDVYLCLRTEIQKEALAGRENVTVHSISSVQQRSESFPFHDTVILSFPKERESCLSSYRSHHGIPVMGRQSIFRCHRSTPSLYTAKAAWNVIRFEVGL